MSFPLLSTKQDEKQSFNETLSSARSDQNKLLTEALTLKLVETREDLSSTASGEEGDEKLNEEVSVKMMADLQERQSVENNALLQAMAQAVSEEMFLYFT